MPRIVRLLPIIFEISIRKIGSYSICNPKLKIGLSRGVVGSIPSGRRLFAQYGVAIRALSKYGPVRFRTHCRPGRLWHPHRRLFILF